MSIRAPLHERDLAGEATERDAYKRRLRADISPEEAAEESAERDERYDDNYFEPEPTPEEWAQYDADLADQYSAYNS